MEIIYFRSPKFMKIVLRGIIIRICVLTDVAVHLATALRGNDKRVNIFYFKFNLHLSINL
jgi:hypothetical protein